MVLTTFLKSKFPRLLHNCVILYQIHSNNIIEWNTILISYLYSNSHKSNTQKMFDALTWVHIYMMITVSDRKVFTTFLCIHSFLQSFSHVCIHQKRSFLALPLSLSCTCIMHPVMDLQRTWSCNGHINPSWANFALFSKPHEYIQHTTFHIWNGPWNILMLLYEFWCFRFESHVHTLN